MDRTSPVLLDGLVCPRCRAGLAGSGEHEYQCRPCDQRYPVVAGIPDFRVAEGPFISNANDRLKAATMATKAATASFPELVAYYYSLTPEVPPTDVARFSAAMLGGVERSAHWLEVWSRLAPWPTAGRLLDVGCGTAPMLAAAPQSLELVGVDLALRWLVVARKRLDELGIRATLVCANAEALPFRDGSVAVVTMDSALEHFGDQSRAASEVHRVLTRPGAWVLATPNRWSLGPDPHIGVPLGGYLPNALVTAVARWRKALPPARQLLGASALTQLLAEAGFSSIRVIAPPIGSSQRDRLGSLGRRLVDVANRVGRVALGNAAIRTVGPLLAAAGRKV